MENQDHEIEEAGPACYHGCFRVFTLPWKQRMTKNEGRGYVMIGGDTKTKEVGCLRKKLDKVKELTEVCGGPKWKNLVRKIGAYCRGCGKQKARLFKKKTPENRGFQYDLNSYNLNFDNGSDGRDGEDRVDFSSRFAAPSSMISQQV